MPFGVSATGNGDARSVEAGVLAEAKGKAAALYYITLEVKHSNTSYITLHALPDVLYHS